MIMGNRFFTYKWRSVATWSFLLRPVWSLPATGPISSVSNASIFIWMSSLSIENGSPSLVNRSRNFLSPAIILSASSADKICVSFNIFTWANEPSMSSWAISWSKLIDALNWLTSWSPASSNRPPHILLIGIACILLYFLFIFVLHLSINLIW